MRRRQETWLKYQMYMVRRGTGGAGDKISRGEDTGVHVK